MKLQADYFKTIFNKPVLQFCAKVMYFAIKTSVLKFKKLYIRTL